MQRCFVSISEMTVTEYSYRWLWSIDRLAKRLWNFSEGTQQKRGRGPAFVSDVQCCRDHTT